MPPNRCVPALSESWGWTLDVLNAVRSLAGSRPQEEFTLAEVYAHGGRGLGRLHPQKRSVEAKIRQQLQRLRDLGFVEFLGKAKYRVVV